MDPYYGYLVISGPPPKKIHAWELKNPRFLAVGQMLFHSRNRLRDLAWNFFLTSRSPPEPRTFEIFSYEILTLTIMGCRDLPITESCQLSRLSRTIDMPPTNRSRCMDRSLLITPNLRKPRGDVWSTSVFSKRVF